MGDRTIDFIERRLWLTPFLSRVVLLLELVVPPFYYAEMVRGMFIFLVPISVAAFFYTNDWRCAFLPELGYSETFKLPASTKPVIYHSLETP
jgi:hypothetical protein